MINILQISSICFFSSAVVHNHQPNRLCWYFTSVLVLGLVLPALLQATDTSGGVTPSVTAC
jgi:hypothetical protein